MITQVRNQGNDYQDLDKKINAGIYEYENTIIDFLENEFQLLLMEEIFVGSSHIVDTRFENVIFSLQSSVPEISDWLNTRNESNYQILIEPIGLYSYIGFNDTILNETSNLINYDTDGTTSRNALSNFLNLTSTIRSTLSNFDIEAFNLRNQFSDASSQYFQKSVLIGNNTVGLYGNTTIEYNNIVSSLESSTNQSYNFDILKKFNLLQNSLSELISVWSNVEITGFGINATQSNYIETVNTNFHTSISLAQEKFKNASYEITNTTNLRADELNIFNKINNTAISKFFPTFISIANSLDEIQAVSASLQNILLNDLVQVRDLFESKTRLIHTFLKEEQRLFNNALSLILQQFEDDINFRLYIGTLSTSLLMIVILTISVISMLIIFKRLEKKFEIVSEGNLSIELKRSYGKTEFDNLEKAFDNIVVQLRSALGTIQITSERLSGFAEELAAGSEEASSSIKEVSDTMREFSGGASEQNIMLSRVTNKLQDHLEDVDRSSTRIGETSNFVLKVAKRTNILGLNASIEAAKAGRYGRGFNVVAEEVRDLSETTKGSANQIAEIIDNVQHSISKAVEDILREVNIVKEVAENTAAGSEEVSAATLEQVTMLEEISETSAELASLSQELNSAIQKFVL